MASNERKTISTYKVDGTQSIFAFSFDYLQKSFIKVTVDGTSLSYGVDYVVTDKQVKLMVTPTINSIVIIYRETSTDRLVSWSDASVLRATDMTLFEMQLLHLAEETADKVQEAGLALDPIDNVWDGRLKRMKNVIDPVDSLDVMNKRYFESVATGFIQQNQDLVNIATNQKDLATIKASESTASASNAKTSENAAKDSETNALTSKNAAAVSETNAKASENEMLLYLSKLLTGANSPNYYQRDTLFTSNKTTINSPNRLWIEINKKAFTLEQVVSIDINSMASWETPFITGVSRQGKDFYIYACEPTEGTTPILKLSSNPNSLIGRKIGGFHCLCADVGTIMNHPLSGYVIGDILPDSIWDISHRPVASPEGMVYVDGLDLWVDIYLAGFEGTNVGNTLKLVSKYGVPVADGGSSPEAFHWYKFSQVFGLQKKRMLQQSEFVVSSLGSNQSTNILGSADPITTGGHKDTTNRRMISNYGLEDCCGCHWQWGAEGGGGNTGTTLVNAYDVNDKNVGGQQYMAPYRALLGGSWDSGVDCGARASTWSDSPGVLNAGCGSRGASEPQK